MAQARKELQDFKAAVIKLAQDFNKIPLNTQRLKDARAAFESGDFSKARLILDNELIKQDQERLLAQKKQLHKKQQDMQTALKNNAYEYILKAQLIAIDYSQKDRIAKALRTFEYALISSQHPDIVFQYALFLQKNNQFKPANHYYQQSLDSYRRLTQHNSHVYQSYVAMTLHNLAALISSDKHCYSEAESFYQEALQIYRILTQYNLGSINLMWLLLSII